MSNAESIPETKKNAENIPETKNSNPTVTTCFICTYYNVKWL